MTFIADLKCMHSLRSFRRNILNKTAYDLGADKIATGHNLDDEIQSF